MSMMNPGSLRQELIDRERLGRERDGLAADLQSAHTERSPQPILWALSISLLTLGSCLWPRLHIVYPSSAIFFRILSNQIALIICSQESSALCAYPDLASAGATTGDRPSRRGFALSYSIIANQEFLLSIVLKWLSYPIWARIKP